MSAAADKPTPLAPTFPYGEPTVFRSPDGRTYGIHCYDPHNPASRNQPSKQVIHFAQPLSDGYCIPGVSELQLLQVIADRIKDLKGDMAHNFRAAVTKAMECAVANMEWVEGEAGRAKAERLSKLNEPSTFEEYRDEVSSILRMMGYDPATEAEAREHYEQGAEEYKAACAIADSRKLNDLK